MRKSVSLFSHRTHRALALAFLSGLIGPGVASADLVPPPIPECVGKPDGTFCKLADGTAGQCVTNPDTRRPGRSWQSCQKDEHECDRLALGAECHGYLGHPAHCREFSNPEKTKTWRTCQADDSNGAQAGANSSSATTSPPPSPAAQPAAPATPPAKKGMFGCAMAPHSRPDQAAFLFSAALLLFALSRRLRRAG